MTTSAQYAKGLKWDRNVDLWARQLEQQAIAIIEAFIAGLVEKYQPIITDWMKENALWVDRTGNARRGLHTEVESLVHVAYTLILDHGDDVSYGVWLELKDQGKYAIIQPALDHFFPIIVSEIRDFLRS